METRFQTSFIPKKPFTPVAGGVNAPPVPRGHTTSLFLTLGGLLFIISLAAAGGMYFWKSYLLTTQAELKTELAEREKQFNPDLIEELKRQNIKIDIAKNLITNHLAASQIFDIIGRFTIESVRFLSLDLAAGSSPSDGIKITMKGIGTSLPVVAFQSDVLSQLERYGLRKVVKNPVLSDPTTDPDQAVAFGFSATIEPASLTYKKRLEAEATDAATSTTSTP